MIILSARTGQRIDSWLGLVAEGTAAGERIIEVDYDVYAEGEAVLGWLNAHVELEAATARDWKTLSMDLLRTMQEALAAYGSETAHVKMFLWTPDGWVCGNLTRSAEAPWVSGDIEGQPRGGIPAAQCSRPARSGDCARHL